MNLMIYDKKDLQEAFGADCSLGEALKTVEALVRSKGEVVCQFRVNGLNLTEETEAKLAGASLDEIEILEVESQNPGELTRLIVLGWQEQLPHMIEQADQLSKHVRDKGIEGQLRSLVQLIDSCQMLVDSLISFDSLYSEQNIIQSKEWKDAESFMAKSIGEALDAFQRKDFVLLADVMEYDIGQALVNWSELLVRFGQALNNSKEENAGSGSAEQGSEKTHPVGG